MEVSTSDRLVWVERLAPKEFTYHTYEAKVFGGVSGLTTTCCGKLVKFSKGSFVIEESLAVLFAGECHD